jgi:hypothetical protein
MTTLFDLSSPPSRCGNAALGQYFTPEWAAQELVAKFLPDVGPRDLVIDPGCGRGPFLKSIPPAAAAIGVEIDPVLAQEAEANTGRRVITGDFTDPELDLPMASAVIGNPPFKVKTIDAFLRRSYKLLPTEGRCAFILPAYVLQTPSALLRWNRHWSISQTLLPRTLFQRARLPLLFVLFEKGMGPRLLVGFTLYHEAHEINGMPNWMKQLLIHGEAKRETWRCVVDRALRKIGGRGTLTEIYHAMQNRGDRASDNRWWKDKVRQVLQLHFARIGPATFALPDVA